MTLHIEPNTTYTLKEIEEGLGIVKVLTLRRWIAEGKLRAVKMGRAWVVMGRDLLSAIDNWPAAK
ncbi:MAG: helix-turn-helix domain-containing protein [Candidatus Auribacterota bacterium]|nr:helix-turn-helix domain-containing protein [Candidatus Auribacterota bacterium]